MEQMELYPVSTEIYDTFTEKFKPKLTTDDCYTPENVYEAVAGWTAREYGIPRGSMVRPFWPGGDYQAENYPEDAVVVDNPPFSILSQIIRFYCSKNIRFLLFTPALTLFTATECPVCYLPCGVSIIYANGAEVSTSFVTNLDGARVRTCPELYRAVEIENKKNIAAAKKHVPKYTYPHEVITAGKCQRWTKYGVEFRAGPEECIYVGALDAQRQARKSIFGGGFLLRPAAAAAAAAADAAAAVNDEEWQLSEREKAMLGMEAEELEGQMEMQ